MFRAKLFGCTAPNTCIVTFNQLVDLVITQEPYQSAGRTFWIVDGGCGHHPNTFKPFTWKFNADDQKERLDALKSFVPT